MTTKISSMILHHLWVLFRYGYYGKRRHHGLFKVSGPKMWNFTVGGLLVPKIDDIEHLFESKETAEENQDLEEVKQVRIPQISSEKETQRR